MICPTGRVKYFCAKDWTLKSALIALAKLNFTRWHGRGAKRLPSFLAVEHLGQVVD
jgi:hypothetical protein